MKAKLNAYFMSYYTNKASFYAKLFAFSITLGLAISMAISFATGSTNQLLALPDKISHAAEVQQVKAYTSLHVGELGSARKNALASNGVAKDAFGSDFFMSCITENVKSILGVKDVDGKALYSDPTANDAGEAGDDVTASQSENVSETDGTVLTGATHLGSSNVQIPFVIAEGCDGSAIQTYFAQAANIPEYQKKIFAKYGWTIVFTDQDLKEITPDDTSEYDGEILCGLCCSSEKIVYIKDSEFTAERAAVHEMGHVMDYMLGRPSSSSEFLGAYDQDKKIYEIIFPYTHLDSNEEKYAEAYNYYYSQPDKLADNCPHLYRYFRTNL